MIVIININVLIGKSHLRAQLVKGHTTKSNDAELKKITKKMSKLFPDAEGQPGSTSSVSMLLMLGRRLRDLGSHVSLKTYKSLWPYLR